MAARAASFFAYYRCRFRAVSWGAAGIGPSGAFLFLLCARAFALDYIITAEGPHHLTVGHSLVMNVSGAVLAGADEGVAGAIAGLPAGVTAVWTNQKAFCCDATAPGIAGLNPVTFTAAAAAAPGSYPLQIIYTSALTKVQRSVNYELIVDPMPAPLDPAPFGPDVPLAGLAEWKSNMLAFGKRYCTTPAAGPAYEQAVWYYDGTRNYLQIYKYTGDPQWLACARALDALYVAYISQHRGNVPGYHVFPQGLALSYAMDGRAADKDALVALLANGYGNPLNVAPVVDFKLSREASYGLEANLAAESAGNPRGARFQVVAELLIGHFDQWFLSKNAAYVQPFMVALAAEALIEYWRATGDPRVPWLIVAAADALWTNSWHAASSSFLYYNGLGVTPAAPFRQDCSNLPSLGPDPCVGPSPDLNLLIAPIYGFAYRVTGDVVFRDRGDQIFNAGTAGAWLDGGKQFSQNYRWSEKYVQWRLAPNRCDLNGDEAVDALDVLAAVRARGALDVGRVVAAALGGACLLGPR